MGEEEIGQGRQNQGIERIGPPRPPEGRCHPDTHLCDDGLIPILTFEFRPQQEGVVARRQIAEHHIIIAVVIEPFVAESLHHIGILHVVHLGIVVHGIGDAQCVVPVVGAHVIAPQRRTLLRRTGRGESLDKDNPDMRKTLRRGGLFGIEIAGPAWRAEDDGSVGRLGERSHHESAHAAVVLLVVDMEPAGILVEDSDGPIRAHPYTSLTVLPHCPDLVVGEPFFAAVDLHLPHMADVGQIDEALEGGEPDALTLVADGLVDVVGGQALLHPYGLCRHRRGIDDDEATALSGEEHPAVGQPHETGDRCPVGEAVDGVDMLHMPLLIDAHAALGTYPDTSVVVFEERVDVAHVVADIYHFETMGACVEAYDALVLHAHPHIAVTVDHHAAGEGVRPVPHPRHLPLFTLLQGGAVSRRCRPQRQFVAAAHPHPSFAVVGHGIGGLRPYGYRLDRIGKERVQQRGSAGHEIDAGAVVAHPDIIVGIQQDAARVGRRSADVPTLIKEELVGVDDRDATHIASHPEETVGHLHDVEHVFKKRGVHGMTHQREGVVMKESDSPVGAYPYTLVAVLADAPDVVAGQAGRIALSMGEPIECLARLRTHDGHPLSSESEEEAPLSVVHDTATVVQVGGQRRHHIGRAVEMLHLAVVEGEPYSLVMVVGDAHQSMSLYRIAFQMATEDIACDIVDQHALFGADNHPVFHSVVIECDNLVIVAAQQAAVEDADGTPGNAVQPCLSARPYIAVAVEGHRQHKRVRQAASQVHLPMGWQQMEKGHPEHGRLEDGGQCPTLAVFLCPHTHLVYKCWLLMA